MTFSQITGFIHQTFFVCFFQGRGRRWGRRCYQNIFFFDPTIISLAYFLNFMSTYSVLKHLVSLYNLDKIHSSIFWTIYFSCLEFIRFKQSFSLFFFFFLEHIHYSTVKKPKWNYTKQNSQLYDMDGHNFLSGYEHETFVVTSSARPKTNLSMTFVI